MRKSLKQDYIDYRIASAKETLKAAELLADNLQTPVYPAFRKNRID
jgi:hypothetical protein